MAQVAVVIRPDHSEGSDMWDNAHSRAEATMGKGKDSGKSPKGEVHYRQGSDDRNCEECVHSTFAPGEDTGTCDVVAGPITASMVSDLFKAESKSAERGEKESPEKEND